MSTPPLASVWATLTSGVRKPITAFVALMLSHSLSSREFPILQSFPHLHIAWCHLYDYSLSISKSVHSLELKNLCLKYQCYILAKYCLALWGLQCQIKRISGCGSFVREFLALNKLSPLLNQLDRLSEDCFQDNYSLPVILLFDVFNLYHQK